MVTNDDLAKVVDTTDAWIVERTGIRSRRRAAEGEATSDLAVEAARKALAAGRADACRRRPDRRRHHHARPDLSGHRRPSSSASWARRSASPSTSRRSAPGFVYALAVADSFVGRGPGPMRAW